MSASDLAIRHQQTRYNGEVYMSNRRTIVVGLSPGNPHYFKVETLRRLFQLAEEKTDKVLLFIPDKISEHNFKAVGSKNPERSAREKANYLRNKCKDVMKTMSCITAKYSYINWMEHVDTNSAYIQAYQYIKDLYQKNNQFRLEVQEPTEAALVSMKSLRGNDQAAQTTSCSPASVDVEEGVKYILKELAFFEALPQIYDNCQEFVFVYHRSWPLGEKYFEGVYDGTYRSSFENIIFQ